MVITLRLQETAWGVELFKAIHLRTCAFHIAGMVLGALAVLVVALPATANAETYFKTQSGKVRCFTSSYDGKIGGAAAVCETYADETRGSFPQGPPNYERGNGARSNIVAVNDKGQLHWYLGDIAGSSAIHDIVMSYGQTYHADGWTLAASSDGTRISNDATGHGMFVSIENVYGF